MGRLQRKKTPAKKKEKTGDSNASAGTGGTVAAGKPPAAAAPANRRPAPASPKKSTGAAPGTGWVATSIQFLREVKAELKKVTWPSRKQTLGSTVVVLVVVAIISLFLGVVDMGLSSLIRLVLR
jgi:preprotein translocase subunit SecE